MFYRLRQSIFEYLTIISTQNDGHSTYFIYLCTAVRKKDYNETEILTINNIYNQII